MKLTLQTLLDRVHYTSPRPWEEDAAYAAMDELTDEFDLTRAADLASAMTDAFAIVGLFWSLKMLLEREIVIARCLDIAFDDGPDGHHGCYDGDGVTRNLRQLSCR